MYSETLHLDYVTHLKQTSAQAKRKHLVEIKVKQNLIRDCDLYQLIVEL